ncbi:hypothetical protein [Lonepinella sp. BR2474]|uniref:hypothetical protein n=1 Tax=Lonepinella sp. BR2474 TaxID=3434548 RepID=UPI003F6E1C4A
MEISKEIYDAILEERFILESNSFPDYQDNNGIGTNFIVQCEENSEIVINLARQTLLIVNQKKQHKK